MNADIIWQGTLDQGAWTVCVTRSDANPDRGILRIREGKSRAVRHATEVPLAYGAMFGPDIDDLHAWQEYAINWVDTEGVKK